MNKENTQCDTKGVPHLAEVLGVDIGEKFRIKGYKPDGKDVTFWITVAGTYAADIDIPLLNPCAILDAVNDPSIVIHLSRFTKQELKLLFSVPGAKWASRDKFDDVDIYIWDRKPELDDNTYNPSGDGQLATFVCDLFPNFKSGDCVDIDSLRNSEVGKWLLT